MNAGSSVERVVIPAKLEGERLDRALVKLLPGWSRSRLAAFVREGRVSSGGNELKKPGILVERDQEITLELPPAVEPVTVEDARERLPVLYEDEHIIVVNKPAGLLTHRREGHPEASLAELAVALFGAMPSVQGEDRPGIAHRLDRDTSGLLVLGRTAAALEALMRQFRDREVKKEYAALVEGATRFESDWIDLPLTRSKRHPDRMGVARDGEGRDAKTFYQVRERLGVYTFLGCKPTTGRTHQIRVHLAAIGHPVIGDGLYASSGRKKVAWPPSAPKAERHMLHAGSLAFSHPVSGEALHFEVQPPEDFATLLEALRLSAAE